MRRPRPAMVRQALLYGSALAALALLLGWMDYRHLSRAWSTEFYALAVAIVFVAFGAWLGNRLTPGAQHLPFERNSRALASLGISPRECEVLELAAEGCPNKVIARRLAISPNTVKTHLASLFSKLGACNRTEAIARARDLHLLP